MKDIGRNKRKAEVTTSCLATNIPTIPVTFHTAAEANLGGFKHNQRSPKRLKDIAPEDVDVLSAPSSDAEDNDLEKAPSKPGRQKGEKKGKSKQTKRDSWIWMESLMQGQAMGDEKLAAYKAESKCFILAVWTTLTVPR
jgi:hypothetical protein